MKAIIFDLEGVILDTEKVWDQETRTFLSRNNIPYHRDEIKQICAGKSLEKSTLALKTRYGLNGTVAELTSERRNIMEALLFLGSIDFLPGARTFLQWVRQSMPCCIATSMDPELLRIVRTRTRLDQRIPEIFSAPGLGLPAKPDPAIFLHAANALCTLPAQCLVIEDSPSGISAAKIAGMTCAALSTTFSPAFLQEADVTVPDFRSLKSWILGQSR